MTEITGKSGKFRAKLVSLQGSWWALIDVQKRERLTPSEILSGKKPGLLKTWAPIGKVEHPIDLQQVHGCYRLSVWYHVAGLLGKITGPIITEDDTGVVSVESGTWKGDRAALLRQSPGLQIK